MMSRILPALGLWLVLLFVAAPAAAQIDEKLEELRKQAYEWRKEGGSDLVDWRDSLRICLRDHMKDDGSGARVDVGDGTGVEVVTPGIDPDAISPEQRTTIVAHGKADADAPEEPFAIIEIEFEDDPQGDLGAGVSLGALFPTLDFDRYRVVLLDDEDEVVVDTFVTDPGPDEPHPGPFPYPNPSWLLWVEATVLDIDENQPGWLCDSHKIGAEQTPEFSDILRRPVDDAPLAWYGLKLLNPVPFYVRGRGGKPVEANKVYLIPHEAQRIPRFVTGASVVPSFQEEATVVAASMYAHGLRHEGIGNPLLRGREGRLSLSDVGEAGDQGVRTLIPRGTRSFRVDMADVQLRNGEAIEIALERAPVAGGATPRPALPRVPMATVGDSLWICGLFMPTARGAEFTFKAIEEMGGTNYTMQMAAGGEVRRERRFTNGSTLRMPRVTLSGFGLASAEADGWDGFFLDVVHRNREVQLRFVPDDGVAPTLEPEAIHVLARSAFEDFTLGYEEITWTFQAAAPRRMAVRAPEPVAAREADVRAADAGAPALAHYPEPFNPATTIAFTLSQPGPVRLEVFDAAGRRVALLADGERAAGPHAVAFDASRLSSGLYFYRLRTADHLVTRAMTLLK